MWIKILSKIWPILIAGGIFSAGVFAYKQWQLKNEEIEKLQTAKNNLEVVHDILADTIVFNNQALEKERAATRVLNKELIKSKDRREDLVSLFQRHDLTRLTIAKPGLIETRVNKSTEEALNEFESITASK